MLSSEDHGHPYDHGVPVDTAARCRPLLIQHTVVQAEVRNDTRDILLYFDNDPRQEIVPLSSGYESWEIVDPSGRQIVAQGGGNVVT